MIATNPQARTHHILSIQKNADELIHCIALRVQPRVLTSEQEPALPLPGGSDTAENCGEAAVASIACGSGILRLAGVHERLGVRGQQPDRLERQGGWVQLNA